MISKTLSDIGNISIYPVMTLVIFFTVFTVMLFLVLRGNKVRYEQMAHLPLEEEGVSAPSAAKMHRAS
ncbi:MAG: hypothetical protein U1F27_06425 [Turneriella sp.]